MHPNNFFLKIIAEAAKATTPPDSAANNAAILAKQAAVFLDGLTAQNPVQQAHALASILSEVLSYCAEPKQVQNIATLGSAILLLLEALHHVEQAQYTQSIQHSPIPQPQTAYQYYGLGHYKVFEDEVMQIVARQKNVQIER